MGKNIVGRLHIGDLTLVKPRRNTKILSVKPSRREVDNRRRTAKALSTAAEEGQDRTPPVPAVSPWNHVLE